jgi:hypothetical protein
LAIDIGDLYMAILGTNLDYSDRDFDSIRVRLFNLISSAFPTWTARQVASFGNILVELYSFVGDILNKYQDNQAAESRWSVATQRKNLIALSKLIGFEPATATASRVDLTISMNSTQVTDVDIPAGTVCRTNSVTNPIKFVTLIDATITGGNLSVITTGENSEPQEDIFTSLETPNYSIVLESVPYLDDSIVLTAGNGSYTEVDSFLNSTSTDRHFTVSVDQNDKVTVTFGDGINGSIPTGTITVLYKTGGGSSGIVEAGTVTVIEGTFQADDSTVVNLSVTNVNASTEATDRHTVEQIRQLAPLSIRVLNRTVSREDYEINALKVAGVVRALMLTSNEETSIAENTGNLYVIPTGGGIPTQALKDDVLESVTVTYPNTLTFNVIVTNPLYKTVDVYAVVYLNRGESTTTVRSRIESNLDDFFAVQNDDGTINENIGFGYDYVEDIGDPTGLLPWSDVHNVVRDTTGVKRVDPSNSGFTLNGERDDVELLVREFPTLGTVTLINGDTGGSL